MGEVDRAPRKTQHPLVDWAYAGLFILFVLFLLFVAATLATYHGE